jgi:endonuclease/exonuclease/phosphatase family metal-dependent hydrolase
MALLNEVHFLRGSSVTYNLHFESKGNDDLRQTQLDELLEDVGRQSIFTPIIAAGDFNFDISQTKVIEAIARSGFTNPFAAPRMRTPTTRSSFSSGRAIDSILIRGPLTALKPQIHNSVTASDHYPLSLTLKWP